MQIQGTGGWNAWNCFQIVFSPNYRWCRACSCAYARSDDLARPSTTAKPDRAAVTDGLVRNWPPEPLLEWRSPADHWNNSTGSSSLPLSGKNNLQCFYALSFLFPSFPVKIFTFEFSPSGGNTSGTEASNVLQFYNFHGGGGTTACVRVKHILLKLSVPSKMESLWLEHLILLKNDHKQTSRKRLMEPFRHHSTTTSLNERGNAIQICNFLPSFRECVGNEGNKRLTYICLDWDRLRIRSTWIHTHSHRDRQTHRRVREKAGFPAVKQFNAPMWVIVIVCCWRTSRCQATQRRAATLLLLPSALAVLLESR